MRVVQSRSGRFAIGRWLCTGATILGVGLSLALASSAAAEVDRSRVRPEMQELYGAIRVLLPLSVDETRFRSPSERKRIRKALSTLAERADRVSAHAGDHDRRIHYLGASLARESRETLERFDAGQLDGARFFALQLSEFCVACHDRLPSTEDSPLARGFVSQEQLEGLPVDQRARLQVATRRFDDALTSFESLFAQPTIHPAELLDALTEYLTVSIRVKRDIARPIPVLRRFAARADLWTNLRSDVERWIQALEHYSADPPGKPSLASARVILEEADSVARYPSDRRPLVHYLIASSQLNRFLEAHDAEGGRDVAEAYYWLGLIASRTEFDYFVSEGDFYLETAIRTAPRDPIAKQAFLLLEEETVLGWTGSGGSHMPADVRENLEALRQLVYPD